MYLSIPTYPGVFTVVRFGLNWLNKHFDPRSGSKISIKSMEDVKKKLNSAIHALDVQRRKLENSCVNLRKKDELYRGKLIAALKSYDEPRAAIFANEVAEIRKTLRAVTHAGLALEQISLRLRTVQDIGDIVVNLTPAISVVKSVRENLFRILPQADAQFEDIGDLLGSILVEAGQSSGYTLDFSTANSEAEEILKSAEKKVQHEMDAEFPTIPLWGEEPLKT